MAQSSQASVQMFGVASMAEFVEGVKESATFQSQGAGKVVMSLLSDAQEQMAGGATEEARKTLNRAKYLVDEFLVKRPGKEG